jgi:hypothetical protein
VRSCLRRLAKVTLKSKEMSLAVGALSYNACSAAVVCSQLFPCLCSFEITAGYFKRGHSAIASVVKLTLHAAMYLTNIHRLLL